MRKNTAGAQPGPRWGSLQRSLKPRIWIFLGGGKRVGKGKRKGRKKGEETGREREMEGRGGVGATWGKVASWR